MDNLDIVKTMTSVQCNDCDNIAIICDRDFLKAWETNFEGFPFSHGNGCPVRMNKIPDYLRHDYIADGPLYLSYARDSKKYEEPSGMEEDPLSIYSVVSCEHCSKILILIANPVCFPDSRTNVFNNSTDRIRFYSDCKCHNRLAAVIINLKKINTGTITKEEVMSIVEER